MKALRICLLIALIGLVAGSVRSIRLVAATEGPWRNDGPHTPPAPPSPPPAPRTSAQAIGPPGQVQGLHPLKAILIVGPIDGDSGAWTESEKDNMELAATELEANGVTVHRFYTPDNDWDQITQAAEGAHFLLYRGHGVYWGPLPTPTVGGFSLKSRFVSSDDIRQDLHLAPNAIVMLYGCFTAGTSSLDGTDIGIEEACRRVTQYSDPFFDVGAAGYYANWYGNAFQMFLRYLFAGDTLGGAYESYLDFNPATVHRTTHADHSSMALWVDKDYRDEYWQYNNAFSGLPDETLASLFAPPTLGNIPDTLLFSYSIPGGQLLPTTHQVTPLNVGGDTPLTWTITTDGDWFTATPQNGITPGPFWITPTAFDTGTVTTYTGAVTATVVAPEGTENSPHRIDLALRVVNTPLVSIHFPLVLRNSAQPSQPSTFRYPNDPGYATQWALETIQAPAAWTISMPRAVMAANMLRRRISTPPDCSRASLASGCSPSPESTTRGAGPSRWCLPSRLVACSALERSTCCSVNAVSHSPGSTSMPSVVTSRPVSRA